MGSSEARKLLVGGGMGESARRRWRVGLVRGKGVFVKKATTGATSSPSQPHWTGGFSENLH